MWARAAMAVLLLFNVTPVAKLDCSGQEFCQTNTSLMRLGACPEIDKCRFDTDSTFCFRDRIDSFLRHGSGNNRKELIVRGRNWGQFVGIGLPIRSDELPVAKLYKGLVSSASYKSFPVVCKMEAPVYLNHSGFFISKTFWCSQILSSPDYGYLLVTHFVKLPLDGAESPIRDESAYYSNEDQGKRESAYGFGGFGDSSFITMAIVFCVGFFASLQAGEELFYFKNNLLGWVWSGLATSCVAIIWWFLFEIVP